MVTEVTSMEAIRKGPVLLDFYTTTCGPCRAMHSIFEEISNEFAGVKVAQVEVTRNPEVSQMFGIMSVPTVIFMQDCQVKEVIRGASTKKNLESMVKKHIGS
jgi:thioredoxin 1